MSVVSWRCHFKRTLKRFVFYLTLQLDPRVSRILRARFLLARPVRNFHISLIRGILDFLVLA